MCEKYREILLRIMNASVRSGIAEFPHCIKRRFIVIKTATASENFMTENHAF